MKLLLALMLLAGRAQAAGIMDASGNIQQPAFTVMAGATATTLDVLRDVRLGGAAGLGLSPGLMVLVASTTVTAGAAASVRIPSAYYSNFYVTGRIKNLSTANHLVAVYFNDDYNGNYGATLYAANPGGAGVFGCGNITNKRTFITQPSLAANAWTNFFFRLTLPEASVAISHGETAYINSTTSNPEVSIFNLYFSGTPTSLQMFIAADSGNCATAQSQIGASTTGTIYVFALPF